jgi:hypothetical protein
MCDAWLRGRPQGAQSSFEFRSGEEVASLPASAQCPDMGAATIGTWAAAAPSPAATDEVLDEVAGACGSAPPPPPHPAMNRHAMHAAPAALTAVTAVKA